MRPTSAALTVTIAIGCASIAQAQGWTGTVTNVFGPVSTSQLQLAVQPNGNAHAIWNHGRVRTARYMAAIDSWDAPIDLAGPGFFLSDVAADESGNAFALLTNPIQSGSHIVQLHVVRYSPSSGTTTTTTLSSNGATTGTGQIVTDAAGNAMVVWGEPAGVHAARYDGASGTWASPVRVSAEPGGGLQLAVDGLNDVTAAWILFQPAGSFLQVARFDSATLTWGTVSTLATLAGPGWEEFVDPPSLAADAAGNVVALWAQLSGLRGIIHASRFVKAAGTWSNATSFPAPRGSAHSPKVASDPAGNFIGVWRLCGIEPCIVQAARFNAASASWSSVTDLKAMFGFPFPFELEVKMDAAGNGIALWTWKVETESDIRIEASRFTAATNQWSAPVQLSTAGQPAFSPNVGFEATGNATVLWFQRLGGLGAIQSTRWIEQPPAVPTDLVVSSVTGNTVTLAWKKGGGSTPTTYLLEGGLTPGSVLGSVRTESAATTFTFTAPSGVFFLRVYALIANLRSVASNEIQLIVNAPLAPSPPANLLGMVNGSNVALSWTNTFNGGAATALLLNVSGTQTASLPLGMSDTASFTAVPGGTYTFTLTASNVSGVSPPSNPVTLTIPSSCTGPPGPPTYFAVARSGSMLALTWQPPAVGTAVTSYLIHASGAVTGSVSTVTRSLTGTVGPGTYALHVVAANACGNSASSDVVTVTVP